MKRSDGTEDVLMNGKYVGFRDSGGKLFLQRCPQCHLENYVMVVASGRCSWCGWKEGDKGIVEDKIEPKKLKRVK